MLIVSDDNYYENMLWVIESFALSDMNEMFFRHC